MTDKTTENKNEEKLSESKLAIIRKLLKSRTVWAGILSLISLIVYFRTGVFMGFIGEDSPDVKEAIENVSLIATVLSNFGIAYFRYIGKEIK